MLAGQRPEGRTMTAGARLPALARGPRPYAACPKRLACHSPTRCGHRKRWHGHAARPHFRCSSATSEAAEASEIVGTSGVRVRKSSGRDWWAVAELHCRCFYPTAGCFFGVLLRFDRVEAIQLATARGSSPKAGNFECLVAVVDDSGNSAGLPPLPPSRRLPGVLRVFAKAKEGYGRYPEDAGIVGSVIVDSLGEHVPPRQTRGRREPRRGLAYLSNLSVEAGLRRRGVGAQLLEAALQTARRWGCRSVALHCDPTNESACGLYRRAGFRRVAAEPPLLPLLEGRPGRRLQLMVKRLC